MRASYRNVGHASSVASGQSSRTGHGSRGGFDRPRSRLLWAVRNSPLETCSHLAIWPGLYVAGSTWYAAQLTGASAETVSAALVFAFMIGVGTYLLDRAKLRDAWLDPADAAAHPSRHAFVRLHTKPIRAVAFGLLGCAVLVAVASAGHSEWWSTIPVVSYAASISYAAVPRGSLPRPKDVFVLKNAYVGVGIALFACVVVVGAGGGGLPAVRADLPLWTFVAATLAIRVFIDAALCDLDDRWADGKHRTATFPVRHGRRAVLNGATSAQLLLAVLIAAVPVGAPGPRWAWAGVCAASAVTFRVVSPTRARDIVDVRFFVEAVAVAAVVGLMQGH